ncbi:unnamed protein product [Phaeothamnion confervicola]
MRWPAFSRKKMGNSKGGRRGELRKIFLTKTAISLKYKKSACRPVNSSNGSVKMSELGRTDAQLLDLEHRAAAGEAGAGDALKEIGNAAFAAAQYEDAIAAYERLLRAVEPPLTVGAAILRLSDGKTSAGTISDLSEPSPSAVTASAAADPAASAARTADIIFDEADNEGADEEEHVPLASLVAAESPSPLLQCAGRLNLARCKLKLCAPIEAVRECTVVAGLAKRYLSAGDGALPQPTDVRKKLRELCAKAFAVRARAHLRQNHVKEALRDARKVAVVDTAQTGAAEQLQKEIERHAERLRRQDRQLAKSVAAWVERSMKVSEKMHAEDSGGRCGGNSGDDGGNGGDGGGNGGDGDRSLSDNDSDGGYAEANGGGSEELGDTKSGAAKAAGSWWWNR